MCNWSPSRVLQLDGDASRAELTGAAGGVAVGRLRSGPALLLSSPSATHYHRQNELAQQATLSGGIRNNVLFRALTRPLEGAYYAPPSVFRKYLENGGASKGQVKVRCALRDRLHT